jgi:multicomponent Na+:H+ antiporter subunit E
MVSGNNASGADFLSRANSDTVHAPNTYVILSPPGQRAIDTQREGGSCVRIAVVACVLFGLWLLFSGMFTPLLLVFGALSSIFVAWLAGRMGLLPPESSSTWLQPFRCLAYLPWFAWQVAKSNADVVLRILVPSKGISPKVFTVPSTQVSDMARSVYANSITLTPGTIAIDVKGDVITVHALSKEGAEGLADGRMDAKVSALEHHP